MVTKEVADIQRYSKGQVAINILVQNFKQNQMTIHISTNPKELKEPILLHSYLIKFHENVIESTGTQIKAYLYSD